ncbi:hypothetical protein CHL78_012310 [Romboutsia weinsteinii]|uniref:DUF4097 domain-containing protein n=2 Tax=Romboutsia weinsteinii TaxID=2020949 RepID=A0A371J1S3_9FIRM|nr:hypothetical protein CHL78_012310 [Romboutsia weinsteinii]
MKKLFFISILMLMGVALLTGCSNSKDDFQQEGYTADPAQIKEININVRDRKIEVSISRDNQIHIDYHKSSKEYYDIVVSDNNMLTMTAASNKDLKDYIGGKASGRNRTIYLQIPEEFLSSLVLSTTNEDILLSNLTITDNLSLSTNGGDIVFEKLNVGNALALKTKNGDINGTIIGSYDDYFISCDIKKGESNLPSNKDGGSKALNVSNNNGDTEIEFINE